MLSAFSNKRVLLLQGPMGPFFWRLRHDLESAGAQVFKVNFCAGDRLYYPANTIEYCGTLEGWPTFLSQLIARHAIDTVMLFGDCRHYHIVVPHVVRWRHVALYVFEEGYLRPDFITIERGGANNFSSLPRDPGFYRALELPPPKLLHPLPVKHAFSRAAVFATIYALTNALFRWRYPHYQHHRPLAPLSQAYYWLRSGWRKFWFRQREVGVERLLFGPLAGRFFLAPLQTHNDAQISVHSHYSTIEEFIEDVLISFVRTAKPEHHLVFKHHPLDRGYCDYTHFLGHMITKYALEGRVHYVHDVHLPTLLDKALGTVVINSTVGLSSLLHDTPVCVMGDPIYNIPGLTFQGALDEFWLAPGRIDRELYERFRGWLLTHNQANGNFYRPLTTLPNRTGVAWPPDLGLPIAPPIPSIREPATLNTEPNLAPPSYGAGELRLIARASTEL
ncbi:capsule biosynthesis protein [Allochromatium palmeri]|uniref:Capsular biosynthesis protein n=1 Tax=Allochromatium palmeri TaxID=231048 RepID=A0A6N8EEL1_9GAMM|nr:capsular biosynthesis protein [Allochromatium palmeri]MTW22665.1 capsular biosynthesis protein [Allochromatium palmeri]